MKKILFAVLMIGICAGCNPFVRYVHIHDRYPVYQIPPKAKIAKVSEEELAPLTPAVRDKVKDTVKELRVESASLRAILESYDAYSKRKNAEYDQLFKKK